MKTIRRKTVLIATAAALCAAAAAALFFIAFSAEDRAPATWHAAVQSGYGVSSSAPQQRFTLMQLQEDFTRFRKTVVKQHPMLYTDREELLDMMDKQYTLLQDGMTEMEFYRVLSPLVARLNCGHSNISISKQYEDRLRESALFFPAEVVVEDGVLFTGQSYGNTKNTAEAPGIPADARIVEINGHSAEAIMKTFLKSIPSDGENTTRKHAVIEHQFSYLYYSLIDTSDSFRVTYLDRGGKIHTLDAVRGLPFSAVWSPQHRLSSIDIIFDMAALRSAYSKEIHDDYAVLRVGSFMLNQGAFADFIEEFFRELEEKAIPQLVLDLRGNWGGTPKGARLLLSYLIDEPVRYFNEDAPFYFFAYKRPTPPAKHAYRGTVRVLMDGASFSTTGHLISLLKYHGIATLHGEESGGSSVCTDGKRKTVLKHTRLRLYCATRQFKTAVSGFSPGRGIMPD